ncbi:hypothetical protein FRB93_011523 [Tulasnella sp. JGI-2019a]|nr:hypothetical protein FRB93_011523 [Tulasnella sp. JGI-2019a]
MESTRSAVTGPPLALFVPEILLQIIGELSAKELVTAALVCTAWLGPAIDTKWRIKDVLLSRLLEKLSPIEKDDLGLILRHPISQDEWTNFLGQYADRVRRLVVDIDLDKTSFKLITTLLGTHGGLFCSNLTSLTYSSIICGSDFYRNLVGLLPGSTLREIELPWEDDISLTASSLPSTISMLVDRAPHVSKLSAQGISFNYTVFSNLKSLSHAGALSPRDYRNMSYCLHLKVLTLRQIGVLGPIEQRAHEPIVTFPYLEEFSLNAHSDGAEAMIESSVIPALRSLRYTRRDGVGPVTVTLLNNILRTSPCLENIVLMVKAAPPHLDLARHDGVRTVSLHSFRDSGSEMEGEDLSWIGHSFPQLQNLTLRINRYLRSSPYPLTWHWHTILSLAAHFQHLQHLIISLHVPVSLPPTLPSCVTPLKSLTALRLEILSVQPIAISPVANYLAVLCPNVRQLDIKTLCELPPNHPAGYPHYVLGDIPAFVKMFFDYKDQTRSGETGG